MGKRNYRELLIKDAPSKKKSRRPAALSELVEKDDAKNVGNLLVASARKKMFFVFFILLLFPELPGTPPALLNL